MSQEPKQNNTHESKEKQDHYQKYRGNSLKVLEQLENSGGLTTRQISDAILGNARVIAVTIQRLVRRCVIDRVENWGWKINCNGMKILSIFSKQNITTNNKNVNITTTQQQQKVNMKKEEEPIIQTENIPSCFSKAYCTITRFWKEKVYSEKARTTVCDTCTFNDPKNFKDNNLWQVVKISI